MILIDSDRIAEELDPLRIVAALRDAHAAGSMPDAERMLVEESGTENGCLVWAGWRRDAGLAVKAASLYPGNPMVGLPSIHSVVVLFDGERGRPLAAIHGEAFTRVKTAADSALAAQLLSRPDTDRLAVVGAGSQAETHVRFMLAVRPSIRSVVVCNRTPERADALAGRLRAAGVDVVASTDAERALDGAGIVSCLTSSRSPVVLGRWLSPGTHLDLVGAYTAEMRETDDAAVLRGRLFADSRQFTLATCGDYSQPIAAGVISPERIEGDLFQLVSGECPARRSHAEITVFKNGGGGHLDLMVARAFHDIARASGA